MKAVSLPTTTGMASLRIIRFAEPLAVQSRSCFPAPRSPRIPNAGSPICSSATAVTNHLRLDTCGDSFDSGHLEAFKLLPERNNDNEKSLEVTMCRDECGNLVKAMMQVAY